ncbi:hypothetical protein E1B28_010627 [Marasmius oreades]|uniref:GST N-terminal domain-containing protein n=1 Tax=Marasmius oreades TaxID=181124 RepID=A0A9P7URP4_9AGAR|nr:uncharacterized protein E1B28_010627 [Marasmius oreades]KAG7091608.1 hypothetical protein E1B28_010627 [Marasmius oreades]
MSSPIAIDFYDIPSKLRGSSWSPSTWRIRYALNYKQLPYKTTWVEYPDIEKTCKQIGAPPTSKKPDGSPAYTVPTIYDPNTGKSVSDSLKIMVYLEETYPSSPERSLIPPGTWGLQLALLSLGPTILGSFSQFILPPGIKFLNEPSAKYCTDRLVVGGRPLMDLELQGEKRVVEWEKVEHGFGVIDSWMKKEDKFLMGDRFIFADLTIGALVRRVRQLYGEDSEEWRSMEKWHGGRWARLVKELDEYAMIH